jgi:hypothetical protein
MLKTLCLLALCFTCCCGYLHAQYENVWVFGHLITGGIGDRIDFNTAIPTTSPITYSSPGEATASVSDINGHLLFYTEGDTVWNKSGVIMPNGKGLTGFGNAGWGYNATNGDYQGALIVPMPANPDKYYVFSLTDQSYGSILGGAGYLFYSVVDMSLNNGNGDVIPSQKGIFIDSNFTESMSGVGGNNCNIWITVGGFSASGQANVFKSYELTATGLNTTAMVSTLIGPPLIAPNGYEGLVKIKFSPNRTKLIRSRPGNPNGLELMDFNAGTGIVSNLVPIDSGSQTGYMGACFSPDNTKLYATEQGNGVMQFNLNNTSIAAITASKTSIDSAGNSELKNGPDGKIYYFPTSSSQTIYNIKTINLPNVLGAGCTPALSPIVLPFSSSYYSTFPNVVPLLVKDSIFPKNNIIVCAQSDSLIHTSEHGVSGYLWSTGSTDSTQKITQSGTYWVRYSSYCHYITDTIVASFRDLSPAITINQSVLTTTLSYSTYQWYKNDTLINGATNSSYMVTSNGNYTVVVGDGNCSQTSAAFTFPNGTAVSGTNFIAGQIKIFPNPSKDFINILAPLPVDVAITDLQGREIKKQAKVKSISIADLAEGVYLLHISDQDGLLLKVTKIAKIK